MQVPVQLIAWPEKKAPAGALEKTDRQALRTLLPIKENMMIASAPKNLNSLLDLIDREGHYPHGGYEWLNMDQPTIAKRIGCSVRTVQTIIKHPAIETWRTRIGGKNVTLLRRADDSATPQDDPAKVQKCKTAIPKLQKCNSKTANPQPKSVKPSSVTEEMLALKRVWIGTPLTKGDKPNYGHLRHLVGAGVTPDMLKTVIFQWPNFQTFCKIRVPTRCPELSRIVAVSYRVKDACAAIQEEHQKVVDELGDQL